MGPPGQSLGAGCNISHGRLGDVKEILKKFGDTPFGNELGKPLSWQPYLAVNFSMMRAKHLVIVEHSTRCAGISDVLK
jgi:hypothetical protein